jgi:hypothetical protein
MFSILLLIQEHLLQQNGINYFLTSFIYVAGDLSITFLVDLRFFSKSKCVYHLPLTLILLKMENIVKFQY